MADSAEAGLAIALRQPLNLITLDIQLPGMDGWALLSALRESSALAGVPVVIISGGNDGNLGLSRGAAAVLQKPISRLKLHAALAGLGLEPAQNRTHTVLVVDDDPKAVELIAAFLPHPEYAVVRCYGGAEAIVLAQNLHPQLILLDLMMPDVDGFDVVEALQRASSTARIPILVVTAKHISASDRKALNHGKENVIRIIPKAGFNRGHFMDEVRRAMVVH